MEELYYNYTGDGSATEYTCPSHIENIQEIKVKIDNVLSVDWSFNVDQTKIVFNTVPETDADIEIYRHTELERIIDFQTGSITADALDLDSNQLFGIIQEAKEGYIEKHYIGEGVFNTIINQYLKTDTIEGKSDRNFVIKAYDGNGFEIYSGETLIAEISNSGVLSLAEISSNKVSTDELWVGGIKLITENQAIQIKGQDGEIPVATWNGTTLYFTSSDYTSDAVDLRGPIGPIGPQGDPADARPDHEWNGTSIRWRKPDGSWGDYVNLQGADGQNGQIGQTGAKGDDGQNGQNGVDGQDGQIGQTGGTGVKGDAGNDGVDGKTITSIDTSHSPENEETTITINGTFTGSPITFTIPDGEDGAGTPTGGLINQAIIKASNDDNDFTFATVPFLNSSNLFSGAQRGDTVVAATSTIDLSLGNNFAINNSSIDFTPASGHSGQSGIISVYSSTLVSITGATVVGHIPSEIVGGHQLLPYYCDGLTTYVGILTGNE